MRLNEFADPREYTQSAIDAEDFRNQLLLFWPQPSPDDLAPPALNDRRQPPCKPR
jgi:hypothetical protein